MNLHITTLFVEEPYLGIKELIMLFSPVLGHFWCSIVTLVTFSSSLREGLKKIGGKCDHFPF